MLAELEFALTFCESALVTSQPDRVKRNADNARKALETVRKVESRVPLTKAQEQEVREKTAKVESLLVQVDARWKSE
jgi:hypothetical protein